MIDCELTFTTEYMNSLMHKFLDRNLVNPNRAKEAHLPFEIAIFQRLLS